MNILIMLSTLLFSVQVIAAGQDVPPLSGGIDQPISSASSEEPSKHNSGVPSSLGSTLAISSTDAIDSYLKVSGDAIAHTNSHISYLMLFIAIVSILATVVGWKLLARNKELHDAYLILQRTIESTVQYSVDVAVAKEIMKKSEDIFQYSKGKLESLENNYLTLYPIIEILLYSTLKPTEENKDKLEHLSSQDVTELRALLLMLHSNDEGKLRHALSTILSRQESQKWLILKESISNLMEALSKSNPIMATSPAIRDHVAKVMNLAIG